MTNQEKFQQHVALANTEMLANEILNGVPPKLYICKSQHVCTENCIECVKNWLKGEAVSMGDNVNV